MSYNSIIISNNINYIYVFVYVCVFQVTITQL